MVTVTYSPGPHLDRFLASLAHATERPVTVVMADNGSTDGAPEEALERYPNARLLRTGANLGYGTAVNRAVAEYLATATTAVTPSSSSWPTPTWQWGPGSIDAAAGGRAAVAAGRLARSADPRSRRLGLPVGAAPAQPDPRWHARGGRSDLEVQPVDGRLPPGPPGAQRTRGRLAVRLLSVAAPGGFRGDRGGSTSATSCTWRTSTSEIVSPRPAGRTSTCPRRRYCTTRGTRPAATRPATWRPITPAPTLSSLIDIRGWWQAPLRWAIRSRPRGRARGLVVGNSRRKLAKGGG